jgi:Tfp pilus assembly protein PilV
MYQKIKKISGITLIELLISILLFSAITGAAVLTLSAGLKIWNSSEDRIDIRQKGSLAMEEMVRYLELANNITAATTTSITFAADVNNNGTDETVALVYDAVNKRINITISGATMILTSDAQSFALSYFQLNTQTSFTPIVQVDRDSIRIVTISLTMNRGSDTITLNSSAFCRNQGIDRGSQCIISGVEEESFLYSSSSFWSL